MRRAILLYAVCVALLAGCGDGGLAVPSESVFEGRNFRVEPATSTGTETIRFMLELRINPGRLIFTTLDVDGEPMLTPSFPKVCTDWCDTEMFSTTAALFGNLGEHRAVILVVDAQNNIAASLSATFTVN